VEGKLVVFRGKLESLPYCQSILHLEHKQMLYESVNLKSRLSHLTSKFPRALHISKKKLMNCFLGLCRQKLNFYIQRLLLASHLCEMETILSANINKGYTLVHMDIACILTCMEHVLFVQQI